MSHSDDKGLVLPPRVAPIQVVIVPIYPINNNAINSTYELEYTKIKEMINTITNTLDTFQISHHVDTRDIRPGNKYYEWERKGIPIRITIGKMEQMKQEFDCVIRYNGEKMNIKLNNMNQIPEILNNIHIQMYQRVTERMVQNSKYVSTYTEFLQCIQSKNHIINKTKTTVAINNTNGNTTNNNSSDEMDENWNHSPQLFLVPWKENSVNELKIKEETKFTIRCYPFVYNKITNTDSNNTTSATITTLSKELIDVSYKGINIPELTNTTKCFYSDEIATHIALFARAF